MLFYLFFEYLFILQKNFGVSIYTWFFHQMLLSCCSIFNELCRRSRSLSEPLSLTACILYHIPPPLSIPFFIFFSLFFTFRALHNPPFSRACSRQQIAHTASSTSPNHTAYRLRKHYSRQASLIDTICCRAYFNQHAPRQILLIKGRTSQVYRPH